MRRALATLAGLALAVVAIPTPAAEAVGAGACTISGTIRFTPSSPATPDRGDWNIAPAVIQCRGLFNVFGAAGNGIGFGERMIGAGQSFAGSGAYTTITSGETKCLHELGSGTVDYWILTERQDLHIREPSTFHLAGAGAFTTPTLRGTFQVPVQEGNCLTAPVTSAVFVAEVAIVRTSGLWP